MEKGKWIYRDCAFWGNKNSHTDNFKNGKGFWSSIKWKRKY